MQSPRLSHTHGVEGEVDVSGLGDWHVVASDVAPSTGDAQLSGPEPLVDAKPTPELRHRKPVKGVSHICLAGPWPLRGKSIEAQTFAQLVEA